MQRLIGLGGQAERTLGVVQRHLPLIGDVAHRGAYVVVDALAVRGDLLGAGGLTHDVADEAVRVHNVGERPVHHHHGDARLILQVVAGGDVGGGDGHGADIEHQLDVLGHEHLQVDLAAAGKRAHVLELVHIVGQILQLLVGELVGAAALQLGRQAEHVDLGQARGEVDALELVGGRDDHLTARMVYHLALAAEEGVAGLGTAPRQRGQRAGQRQRQHRRAAELDERAARDAARCGLLVLLQRSFPLFRCG